MTTVTDFRELAQEFYPGTSRPIIRHPNRNSEEGRRANPDSYWDRSPRVYNLGGKEREFFTVGNLAEALGRKSGTVRKWERDGVTPPATYQAPSNDPRGRRRHYSREQVEGIVRIAEEEGVLVSHATAIKSTNFTARVIALFNELRGQA